MKDYAIIQTGGKQYQVSLGSTLEVELLGKVAGDVVFDQVLLVRSGEDVLVGTPTVPGITVSARVVEDAKKGEKIRVFKYKAKSRYRKNRGHRQSHTILMVTALGDKKVQESPKPKATILANKKSPAKKPVVKKATVKKTVAKKPAK